MQRNTGRLIEVNNPNDECLIIHVYFYLTLIGSQEHFKNLLDLTQINQTALHKTRHNAARVLFKELSFDL